MDYRSLCLEVVELAREVGIAIKMEESKVKGSDVETKSLNSLVSYVDKEAEKKLVAELGKLLPEAGFIAEEGTSDKKGENYNWIIDPLDGTTNFLHGIPVYSVSIALEKTSKNAEEGGPKMVLGVVYEVSRDECFYSWEGGAAYLNNEEIKVSRTPEIKESLLATGFPYYDYERVDAYFEVLKHFAQNSRGIRRMGSAAVDLVYVACGRFDGFFEYSLQPWDVAAGAFIVQQAGGAVYDFKGGHQWLHGQELLAANGKLDAELLAQIKQI